MTIVLRAGLVLIAIVTVIISGRQFLTPLSVECEASVNWTEAAPHGAIWTKETILWETPPAGYYFAVGWINAATILPCADESTSEAKIELRQFRVIGVNKDGEEFIALTVDPRNSESFSGRLFPRVPKWFGETEGKNELLITSHKTDALTIDLSSVPLRVYHAWTDPRFPIEPETRYYIEAEALISGSARLQLGLDYWRDASLDYSGWDGACLTSNNCEGWISDWYSDTAGEYRTFRAPFIPSFPLPESIHLAEPDQPSAQSI